MGMWDDVVSSNVASVAVADERVARKGLTPDARNYHSLLWLEYAYLQEGRKEEAHGVLEDLARSAAQSGSSRALSHLGPMRAFYALETGEWDRLSGNFDLAKGGVMAATAAAMAQGAVAVRQGRIEEGRKMLVQLRANLSGRAPGVTAEAHHAGAMPAAAPPSGAPNNSKEAEIMAQQLEAILLQAAGKRDEALQLLAGAAASEDALSFEFGPPMPVKPTHELWGEMLLAAGRPREARSEFERALAKCPKRALSLRGLAKAAAESGDPAAAQRARDDLKSFWHGEAL
jgi:tetratricopeptide (TPR) repeat protein